MSPYVTGLLVRNECGAMGPSSTAPADRWLVIQTASGAVIRVFDYTVLSNGLFLSEQPGIHEGQRYTFVIMPFGDHLENVATATQPLEGPDVWQGTVVQATWSLAQQEYLAVDPDYLETVLGILVETSIGQLIVSHSLVNDEDDRLRVGQGEVVRWENMRFDLIAVMKPVL